VDEDVRVLDEVMADAESRRGRRWRPRVVATVVLVALGVLAWATFVGWDTTAHATTTDPSWCREHIDADGTNLAPLTARGPAAGVDGDLFFPLGDEVRIHHQLFHHNRYTFVAADGTKVPATDHGPYYFVACGGGPG
jgi:hypothetical protein